MSSADAEHKSKLEEQAKGKAGIITLILVCHGSAAHHLLLFPCILLLQPCIHTQAALYELLPSARPE